MLALVVFVTAYDIAFGIDPEGSGSDGLGEIESGELQGRTRATACAQQQHCAADRNNRNL